MKHDPKSADEPWHTLVQRVAKHRFPNERTRVRVLAGLMQEPDSGKVDAWLQGRDVPRTTQEHDALMQALDLKEREADLPLAVSSGPRWQKAQMRESIEAVWEDAQALAALMPHENEAIPLRAARPLSHRAAAAGSKDHGKPTESYPRFPARLRPQKDYDRMATPALDALLQATPNAHEFIAAFERRYYPGDFSSNKLMRHVAKNRTTLDMWKDGQCLPGERLGALKALVEENAGAALAERFEDIVIGNRLAIVRSVDGSGSHGHMVKGEHLSFMPQRYWKYLLDACEAEHGKRDDSYQKSFWAPDAFAIQNKGDYLRAARCFEYGRDSSAFCEQFGMISPSHLRHFETSRSLLSAAQLDRVCAALPIFDRTLYEALPKAESRAAEVIAQRQASPASAARS